jgi:hypothetical protein
VKREPTLGDAVSALDRETLERAFILAFGIVDFYAEPTTYFAVSLISDPPAGDIMRDFGPTDLPTKKPGRRARLAQWMLVSAMQKALTSKASP